jgi:hypothetical protein
LDTHLAGAHHGEVATVTEVRPSFTASARIFDHLVGDEL